MAITTSYSEWVRLLDKFGEGDDSVISEFNSRSFELDAGTAQRFYKHVEETYKKRKEKWLTQFQKSFTNRPIKSESDIIILLREGKQNLLPLLRFASTNGMPVDLSNLLKKDLDEFVCEIRKSLKENLSRTQAGREKILMMFNSFGLYSEIPIEEKRPQQELPNNIIPPGGRKIIL